MPTYDIIIAGGGPAGLTAGLYTSRAGLKTLLLEKIGVGGQAILTDWVENYPGFPEGVSGAELIERFEKQAKLFGLEIKQHEVAGVEAGKSSPKKIKTSSGEYEAHAIIIATGASPKELGVAGERESRGRGVSYCATCDGPLFKNKNVVVVGGGDTAVQEALFLTRFAKEVTLVHRRDRLRATKILQERILANPKMKFAWESALVKINGDKSVASCAIKNIKTGATADLPCEGVFIFVGLSPATEFIKGIVNLDEQGYIMADSEMRTSAGGIFAAGDVIKKPFRQIVNACGEGASAAHSAQIYVEELKGVAYK